MWPGAVKLQKGEKSQKIALCAIEILEENYVHMTSVNDDWILIYE